MKDKSNVYMNPYLAGMLLGLVIISAFYFSGEGLGGSGAFKDLVGTVVIKTAPDYAANSHLYAETVKSGETPLKSWLVFEVLGVILGAIISGAFAGRLNLKLERSPKISSKSRIIMALLGGLFFGVGSQLGRGCTSGAGLSGMAVLSVSGFIAAGAIFGTAYLVAYFFRKFWI